MTTEIKELLEKLHKEGHINFDQLLQFIDAFKKPAQVYTGIRASEPPPLIPGSPYKYKDSYDKNKEVWLKQLEELRKQRNIDKALEDSQEPKDPTDNNWYGSRGLHKATEGFVGPGPHTVFEAKFVPGGRKEVAKDHLKDYRASESKPKYPDETSDRD